jgi:L-amino acid N-acyltransferase YncA
LIPPVEGVPDFAASEAADSARRLTRRKACANVSSMRIRDAVVEDAGQIAGIHVRSWQFAYRGIVPDDVLDALSTEQRRAFWVEELVRSSRRTLVVEVDEAIAGWAAFGPCRDADAPAAVEVYGIYLDPAFLRRGLGKLLWAAACRAMAADGHARAAVWVVSANDRARRFYESMGGVLDDSASKVVEREGVPLPQVRYWCPTQSAQAIETTAYAFRHRSHPWR